MFWQILLAAAVSGEASDIIGKDRRVVETTLAVETNPLDIAMAPDGTVYVGQFTTGKIAEIKRRKVERSVYVGGGVTGLAMNKDGTKLWAGLGNENAIALIDPATLTVIRKVEGCGFVIGVRLTPDEKTIVGVCNANDAAMIVPASLEGKPHMVSVGDMPYYVAISPDSKRAWVSNHYGNSVSLISLAEKIVLETIPVGSNPVGLGLTNDGETLYVANYGGGNVSVISTASNKVYKTLGAGMQPYWVAAHPKRDFVVVSNYGSNGLDVFHV